ncbi:hypothetical protein [Schinkia azotoformans]|uniref:hypothetical protein n=1 Tax=Schinkia azotoformans TaxID=1454 RepID=UPI002DBB7E37|nr:hypothetical protein [Schinkia azotoformans]MEC1744121.1 hypothetical protein [Schinkia azotoformans]
MSTKKIKSAEQDAAELVVTQEENQEEEAQEMKEPLIYCGPNLLGSKLNQFTVYQGGYPIHLEKELSECESIKRLFVPVSKLALIMSAISNPGTPESIWFEEINRYNGGVK